MIKKKEKIKKITYTLGSLLVLLMLWGLIYVGLELFRAWSGGLEKQIAQLLEDQFGARVEIERVEGELPHNIVIKNAVIYREFREDQVLLRASEVQIKVDLVSGLLKDKVLIRSLKKLIFKDFDLYIDEDLSNSKLFRTIFIKKETGKGIESLEVELVDGRVHSDFSNPDYPALEILDLDLTVQLSAPSFSIEGTGFLREKTREKNQLSDNSFLYGTETPFHLQMDNFNQSLQGVLDLKELHYMGGTFRSLALQMNFDKRKLSIQLEPSDYAPFLLTLTPGEQRTHYTNGRASMDLPQLLLNYSFDTSLFHLGLSAEEPNQNVSDIVLYYMANSPLKEYMTYLHPNWNGQFLGSFDLWLSPKGVEFLLRVDQTKGILKEGDRLSFELEKRIEKAFVFRQLVYSGPARIQAEGFFDPETKEQDFQVRVNSIPLRWIDLKTFSQIVNSSGRLKPWFERIHWEEDFFSGQIHFSAKDGKYHLQVMRPRVSVYSLWNMQASFSIKKSSIKFEVSGVSPFEYNIKGFFPRTPRVPLLIDLHFAGLQYRMIQELFFLQESENSRNFGFGGEISAWIDLEDWQNSKISALLKLFSEEDRMSSSVAASFTGKEKNEKTRNIEEPEPLFWLSVGYEKQRFFLYDSKLKDYEVNLTGNVEWSPENLQNFRSKWVLLYSKDRYDLDLEFEMMQSFYRTKLRVDRNQIPWASLSTDWTLKDSRLDFERAVLSDGVAFYDLLGFLDWKKETVQTDLLLIARENPSKPMVHLKGNLGFSRSKKRIQFFPKFSLRIRELALLVAGSLASEGQKWFPNLQFTWGISEKDQKTLGLEGWLSQESNQFQSQISFSFQKKNYFGEVTLVSLGEAWDYHVSVDGVSEQPLGVRGRISLVSGGLENQLFLFQKENEKENILLESKATVSFREDRFYTHWVFNAAGNRLDLNGYLEKDRSNFLTRFQVQFFQEEKRKLSWWWDAVIRKNKNNWELKGKSDSGVQFEGLYENYSKLSLDFWLEDFRFSLGSGRYVTFDSSFLTQETSLGKRVEKKEVSERKSKLSLRFSPGLFHVKGNLWIQEKSSFPDIGVSLGILYTLEDPEKIEIPEWNVYQKKPKGWSTVLKSSGSLSLIRGLSQEDQWVFQLIDPQKIKIFFRYNPKNGIMGGNLEFLTLDFNDFSDSLRGTASGILSFGGSFSHPKIESKGIRVDRFFYQNQFWNMEFSFMKEEKRLVLPYVFLSGSGQKMRLWNFQYIFSNPEEGLDHFAASFLEGGIVSLERAVFSGSENGSGSSNSNSVSGLEVEELKFWVSKNLISVIQDFSNKITEPSQWLFLYKLLNEIKEESETRLNMKAFRWNDSKQSLEIKNLYMLLSSNWRFDLGSFKMKSIALGPLYAVHFSVFGGRKGKQSELFFQANRLLFADKSYAPFEMVFQGLDNHWSLLSNRLGIELDLLFQEESVEFRAEYLGNTEIGTRGEIRLKQDYIEGFFWLKNENLSISKVAPIFFERLRGKIDSQIYFYGPWKNPKLEGYFELEEGQLRWMDSKETLRNLNVGLYFDNSLFHREDYKNYLRVSAEYGGGKGFLQSHFNFWNWNISEIEASLDIPSRIKINVKTPTAEYKGAFRAKMDLLASENEKTIKGTVFLGKGKLLYLGEEISDQKRHSSWIDAWNIKQLRILVEKPIRVNLGRGGLSLGEVVLKEYLESTQEGTWIELSRTLLEDFQFQGVIESDRGFFDYLGKPFRIMEAKVEILPGRNPELELVARTKVRDINNQVINLYLQIKEDIYSLIRENQREAREQNSESILDRFSSIPSKSRQEIAFYMGIPLENQEEDNRGVGGTADMALNLTLIRPVEQIFRDTLGIDTLSIQQNFLQNSFFQNSRASRSDPSQGAFVGDSRKNNLFHNTEITLGKYLTQNLYLSGGVLLLQSQDLRRPSNLDDIWILGLEMDLLPLFRVESKKFRLQFLTEYQNRRHEIVPRNRHEGLFSLELGMQF